MKFGKNTSQNAKKMLKKCGKNGGGGTLENPPKSLFNTLGLQDIKKILLKLPKSLVLTRFFSFFVVWKMWNGLLIFEIFSDSILSNIRHKI